MQCNVYNNYACSNIGLLVKLIMYSVVVDEEVLKLLRK